MVDHDQIFKELLHAFFPDFLRLAAPEVAARLDLARARFLEAQAFTAVGDGERRELDLVTEVPLRGGRGRAPETALVHVEIEARPGRDIGWRLGRYAMQMRLRHGEPQISLLLALKGGPPGPRIETVADDRLGLETNVFRYVAFGLAKCRAEEYAARPEPLAWALAALMRPAGSRAAQKLACLKPIAAANRLSNAKRFLLFNCVETYLQLDADEAAEYEALQSAEGNQEVKKMAGIWAGTWAEKMFLKGEREGEKKGERKGRTEGAREVVLRQLGLRFGPLPEETRRRVEAISSPAALARLADKVLVARSLEEMGLA